ncbi:MAG TPA: lamin tail domain-containing protein, partial [Methylomirabilota bacterium]|nr:lamin tail domain-containing protein [Methylomirabilota bacterium]
MHKAAKLLSLLAVSLALMAPATRAAELIPKGSTWKYFIGTQEASSPVEAWRAVGFNDASWSSGPAPIGYGDGDEATVLPTSAAGNYLSLFFRKTFVIANPATVSQLILSVTVDDGAVAWLNGTEVGRINLPEGPLAYNSAAVLAEERRTMTSANIASLLVPGSNVIAIQAFNANLGSSDLNMDAVLTAELDEAPTITLTDPAPSTTVTELTLINVVFSESVSGVDAADLLINGVAATGMQVVSPREYVFTFPQPPTGAVSVAFAEAHGIVDQDQAPDAFAGASWNYTLDPNAVPSLAIISEFMADNENARYNGQPIRDEDGNRSDWIEIYNPGLVDINLDGWSLTDDPANAGKWKFPGINLGPNRYLIVWASAKNRTNANAPLHTNFRLSNNAGGYLALLNRNSNVVSRFQSYPAQPADVSYGRDRVDPNLVGFFVTPTPGAQNSTAGGSFAPTPQFSLESGVYTNASLTLSISAPGYTIRYTLDGSEPTNNSPLYSAPITFTTNMIIKARAFATAPGVWPSAVAGRSFVMLDSSTRDFNSNLPLLIISTQGRTILENQAPGAARVRGTLAAVDTFRGRASLTGKPDYLGFGQFEIVGQTSAGFAKKPIRIELNDELGNDKDAALLGLPAEADWNLRNPHNDKTLMNDFLGYELWEEMGHYSCRRRYVELFLDTGGGKVTYPGDYYGVMVLFERIEIGDNRVDIGRLTPAHTNEPAISGGYIIKKDKDSAGDTHFTTSGGAGHSGHTLKFHDPKPREITALQSNWIANYVRLFETSMYNANWTNATGTNHYSHYIDVDQFVDQHLHVEFTKQIDGYRLSSYYSKPRNGKLRPEPIWDWNLAFGNADYLKGGRTNGWYWADEGEGMNSGTHIWLRRLVFGAASGATWDMPSGNGSGDPDFRQKITDRWAVLRTNVLNGPRVIARINELEALLREAAARNWAKYPTVLNTDEWPNPNGSPDHVDYSKPTSAEIIAEMRKWVAGRFAWMDNQFLGAPTFSLAPGHVPAGTSLTISGPQGTIYYTTDGTDPRLPGGGISPTAQVYSGPIAINGNVRIVARVRRASNAIWTPWGAPTAATYVVATPPLIISEIMFHPADPPAGNTNAADNYEFIEFKNNGTTTLNLAGFRLRGGADFVFGNVNLAPGARGVLVSHAAAFTARYGNGITILGEYTNRLANDGERLVLEGPVQEPILDFEYKDGWYPQTDGLGFSLVIRDENGPASAWTTKEGWRPSGVVQGTPGAADPGAPSLPQVVINEALTHTASPNVDAIELHNLESQSVDIGGWYLSDDFNDPKKYRFPNGTTIEANGYLVVNESAFNSGSRPFSLSSLGEQVYLYSADENGNLTGYVHGFDFGAQFNGVTFGRHLTSTGNEHFVAQQTSSLGADNTGPRVGPVVVTEINYHPVDIYNEYGVFGNEEDEYIELHNLTAVPVPLSDSTNRWQLRDAVDYTFPPGAVIPAGAFVLVVSFDPADSAQLDAFRARNLVATSVPVFGPFRGRLDNAGESIELVRPDPANTNGPVPYVLVDKVRYASVAPWPAAADGIGPSLQRVVAGGYGNDPANWVAAGRSPGSAYMPGPAPVIVQQPQSQTNIAYDQVIMSVVATGQGVLSYQWRLNGVPIFGQTGPSLVYPSVLPSQAGTYDVVVMSGGGAVTSDPATLTLRTPIRFTTQPEDVNIRTGS